MSKRDRVPTREEIDARHAAQREQAERRARLAAEHPELVPGTKEHRNAQRKHLRDMRKQFGNQYGRRYLAPGKGN